MLDISAAEILDAIRRLVAPNPGSTMRILLRDDDLSTFVGRQDGNVVVLGMRYAEDFGHPPDLRTDHAALTFANAVALQGHDVQGPYMLLALDVDLSDLDAFVAALFEGLLDLAQSSWLDCLDAAIAAVESFQRQREAHAQLEQQVGLFGELLIMLMARDPDSMVRAWHHSRYSVHDFSIGTDRLEVKSSMSPRRVHWLSDAQLSNAAGEAVTIASLYVPITSSGITVEQLALAIRARLTAANSEFERKLTDSMPSGPLLEFDQVVAGTSLTLIPGALVPRPKTSDPRILGVKWRVDMSTLLGATSSEVAPWYTFLSS